jgi:hypothetical protein
LEEIDVHEDLGESDLESEFSAIEPSSFMTELKSARADDDMLEVSVRFELDWDAMVMPTIPFDIAKPPAPLPDGATFSLLSSSDDIESPRSEEAAYPSSLPLPIASVSDLVPSDESSRVIEDIFLLRAQFTPTLFAATPDLDGAA